MGIVCLALYHISLFLGIILMIPSKCSMWALSEQLFPCDPYQTTVSMWGLSQQLFPCEPYHSNCFHVSFITATVYVSLFTATVSMQVLSQYCFHVSPITATVSMWALSQQLSMWAFSQQPFPCKSYHSTVQILFAITIKIVNLSYTWIVLPTSWFYVWHLHLLHPNSYISKYNMNNLTCLIKILRLNMMWTLL